MEQRTTTKNWKIPREVLDKVGNLPSEHQIVVWRENYERAMRMIHHLLNMNIVNMVDSYKNGTGN